MLHEEEPAGKYARASLAGSKSSNRHIQTEQRRRDRINEGHAPHCCLISCREPSAPFALSSVSLFLQVCALFF